MMDAIKNLTPIQVIGIFLGMNSLFITSTPQLTVLFGAAAIPYIDAVATLANGALGVVLAVIGGQGSQIKNVLAMPGVDKITVNGQANATLATLAVDRTVDKIAPTQLAESQVVATAKAAASLIAIFVLGSLLLMPSAFAQVRKPDPIGQVVTKLKQDFTARTGVAATGDLPFDLLQALDKKLLPDLQYALLLAQATGSKVTAPCYQAWIDIINTQQTAGQTKAPDGTVTDVPLPDIHMVTDFERMVELRNALQPDSDFMRSCSPVANMVKQDVVQFMGIVISGGAGLATLVPGL